MVTINVIVGDISASATFYDSKGIVKRYNRQSAFSQILINVKYVVSDSMRVMLL